MCHVCVQVRYALAADTDPGVSNTFSINEITGVITLTQSLDFEQNNLYQFYAEARDLSTAPLTTNVSVT